MADGVEITAGSGTTILTDDTGAGGHAQIVKLAISTDGSGTLVPADATNGIDVDVTRVSGNVTVVQATASNLNANVSGTVTANAGTGNFTVTQGTAANLNATVVQGTAANLNATVVGSGNFTVVQPTAANLNATVVGSGNFTVTQATASNLNAQVVGTIAHGSADSGNPQKNGTRARNAVITSVANDQRSDAIGTLQGYLVTYPYALPQSSLTGTASATGTSDTAVIAAQGAGITINVTTITVYNDSTTNTFVNIKDGATTRLVIPAPAKGGAMVTLPSPLRITANTALNFASNAGVTTMYVSAVGFAGI